MSEDISYTFNCGSTVVLVLLFELCVGDGVQIVDLKLLDVVII